METIVLNRRSSFRGTHGCCFESDSNYIDVGCWSARPCVVVEDGSKGRQITDYFYGA